MRDYIKSIVDKNLTQNDNFNRVREYIQFYLLYVIYKKKFFQNLVFTGGTVLRFVHKIRRFSEDIDFSLSAKAKNYDFDEMIKGILYEFKLAGYDIDIKYSSERTVHSALLKFSGILFEAGLSPLKSQEIAIKMEVDSNPPKGGKEESSVYNGLFTFSMLHYDLASLLAGKVHALLCREYTKGKDWYDLMWYLSKFKGIEPNFIMLNNAMAQTLKNPVQLIQENWKTEIKKVVKTLDWAKVRNDVERFLEDSGDIKLLTPETFINLLDLEPTN
ncbi:MAG: nucleotidyl transferase AbiEii/AbiGii toxin family protein [Candidatus Omnitrophota bacterium]